MSDQIIRFDRVDAYYGRAKILHEVSVEVGSSDRLAILGRNGAGKTTLVNALLGIAQIKQGHIELAGTPMGRRIRHFTAARSGVAVVPQGRRIVPGLTVTENLQLGAAVNRAGPWNMERVFSLFPILRERALVMGTSLSGGQQQMLAIGRALMANPSLLICDEPSEGLAPVVVDELAVILRQLADAGTGILLIEQNIGLVKRVAQRYCVLSKGSIVDRGALDQLTTEMILRHVAV